MCGVVCYDSSACPAQRINPNMYIVNVSASPGDDDVDGRESNVLFIRRTRSYTHGNTWRGSATVVHGACVGLE